MNVQMPCAVNRCDNPAIHIVHMKVKYWEKRQHEFGKRWHRGEDTINLFVCRTHRGRWLQKGAELIKEGGLI